MNPEITLRNLLTAAGPNPTIYTVLRRRGPSGLGNAIGAYVLIDGIPYDLIPSFCRATDRKMVRALDANAVKVQGVGMDSGLYLAKLIAAAAGVQQFSHRWI